MLRKRAKRTPNARAKSPARVGFLNVMDLNSCRWTLECGGLQCGGVGLAGADAHGGIEGEDKNLSVPDLAGLGGRGDGIDRFLDLVGRYRHFDLDLRQEAHGIFSAAINFRVALLTPISLDLRHGHSVHADRSQSVADLVELERLDDGHDDFHGLPPLAPLPAGAGCGQSSLSAGARSIAARASATATNQAPCQFAAAVLSISKQMIFAQKLGEGRGPLTRPSTNTAQGCLLIGQRLRGNRLPT